MDLYKLPKDMLVKLVAEIREDVKEEYEEKLRKVNVKIDKAVEAGIFYYHCSKNNCENFYAMTEFGEMDEDFFYCEDCEREYCNNHTYLCDYCDIVYCQNCYEAHLIFCKECKELSCKYNHRIECYDCYNKTQMCNTDSVVLCDECLVERDELPKINQ